MKKVNFLSLLLSVIFICGCSVKVIVKDKEQSKSSSENSVSSVSQNSVNSGELLYPEYANDFSYIQDFNDTMENYNALEDKNGTCKIHFVDVGQGDCMVIELPDGKCMVIDSGENKKAVKDSIGKTMTALGITQIDYLIATHQDSDHIGSMPYIFSNYEIKKVFRPYVLSTHASATDFTELFNQGLKSKKGYSNTATYYNFLKSVLDEGCDWEFFTKDSEVTGNVVIGESEREYLFNFLTPTKDLTTYAYSDANNYSPVVLFSYLGVDILFTGDAENEVLNEYMTTYNDVYDIDVLKVGHHGSYTSTSDPYIKAIKPEYAVIQVGLGNTYRHPRQETLDILKNNGVLTYRNDLNGQIVLTISPDGSYFIQVEKTADYQSILNGL